MEARGVRHVASRSAVFRRYCWGYIRCGAVNLWLWARSTSRTVGGRLDRLAPAAGDGRAAPVLPLNHIRNRAHYEPKILAQGPILAMGGRKAFIGKRKPTASQPVTRHTDMARLAAVLTLLLSSAGIGLGSIESSWRGGGAWGRRRWH